MTNPKSTLTAPIPNCAATYQPLASRSREAWRELLRTSQLEVAMTNLKPTLTAPIANCAATYRSREAWTELLPIPQLEVAATNLKPTSTAPIPNCAATYQPLASRSREAWRELFPTLQLEGCHNASSLTLPACVRSFLPRVRHHNAKPGLGNQSTGSHASGRAEKLQRLHACRLTPKHALAVGDLNGGQCCLRLKKSLSQLPPPYHRAAERYRALLKRGSSPRARFALMAD